MMICVSYGDCLPSRQDFEDPRLHSMVGHPQIERLEAAHQVPSYPDCPKKWGDQRTSFGIRLQESTDLKGDEKVLEVVHNVVDVMLNMQNRELKYIEGSSGRSEIYVKEAAILTVLSDSNIERACVLKREILGAVVCFFEGEVK
jgi:hypothetical protein